MKLLKKHSGICFNMMSLNGQIVWSSESRNLRIEFEVLKCKRRSQAIVFEDKWKTVFLCSFVFTLSLLYSTGINSSVSKISCWLEFDWSQCRILILSRALEMQIRRNLNCAAFVVDRNTLVFDPSSFIFPTKADWHQLPLLRGIKERKP